MSRAVAVMMALLCLLAPGLSAQTGRCTPEQTLPGFGAVTGRVVDPSTGVPVGRVEVWLISDDQRDISRVEADGGGRFAFCSAEPGPHRLRAVFPGFGEATAQVLVEAGKETSLDLPLLFEDPTRSTGTLRGQVVAVESGDPLEGATVILNTDGPTRITDDLGAFHFDGVPAGSVNLNVSLLGYEEAEGGVVLGGGQSMNLEVRLSPRPIELEPIIVEAASLEIGGMLADVRTRAGWAFGTVLMADELEPRRNVTRTTDILREYGANVVNNGGALYFRRTGCGPSVYIDGVRVTHEPRSGQRLSTSSLPSTAPAAVEAGAMVNLIHPLNIEAIEIYRSPGETPGEFLDANAQCGTILIWTKRGGS